MIKFKDRQLALNDQAQKWMINQTILIISSKTAWLNLLNAASYLGLNTKNHELLSSKNTNDEWYFSKTECVR